VSALSFELKGKPDQRLDLSPLVPSRLKDLKPKEIEAIAIGQQALVGQFWTDPAFVKAYSAARQ